MSTALLPLSLLYRLLVTMNRWLYRRGWRVQQRLRVPVIIVGNISVGGTGKTPLVQKTVEILQQHGFRPGIISRGYGGQAARWPQPVSPASDPAEVGDEPVLLARRCECPVMVGPDRVAVGRALLAENDCDIIVADDGLQHYRLARTVEIAVIDGQRGLGNQRCLPAGPLREPANRLQSVDLRVVNSGDWKGAYRMDLQLLQAINLANPSLKRPVTNFAGSHCHAIAAIGHPARFFNQLRQYGLRLDEHPFRDHYAFTEHDLVFSDADPILMTEKDAVKCQAFARSSMWYLPVEASLDASFERDLLQLLATRMDPIRH